MSSKARNKMKQLISNFMTIKNEYHQEILEAQCFILNADKFSFRAQINKIIRKAEY